MGVGITVEHLNAFYAKTQALFDINITVQANHATALIGPSGDLIGIYDKTHPFPTERCDCGACPPLVP